MKHEKLENIDLYNCDFLEGSKNNIKDKSIDLIIADPPYFKVKGKFDFIWKTFEDYLKDVEKWAVECKRILKDNGTMFWWGMDRKIAYSQIIIDKYFYLIGVPIWEKPNNPNEWDTRRTFPERAAERLLMYANEEDTTGLEQIIEEYIKPQNPFSEYLRSEFKNAKVSNMEISKLFPSKTGNLTGCVSNWLNGNNIITKDQYFKVREYLNDKFLKKEYEELRLEYEELRLKYEELRLKYEFKRRYFNNSFGLTDVFRFPREVKKYEHETVKPMKLTRVLIQTCSRKGDLICVPFAGSGTECVASDIENRNCIAFELDEGYFNSAVKRIKEHQQQLTLF